MEEFLRSMQSPCITVPRFLSELKLRSPRTKNSLGVGTKARLIHLEYTLHQLFNDSLTQ